MLSRVAILFSLALALRASTLLQAQTIPCESTANSECITSPTCQANGTCRGEPAREGLPCTEDNSGGCMTTAFCKKGVCTGTVAVTAGTPCNYPSLANCYSPGHCMVVGTVGFCVLGTPKICTQPSDPCKLAFCNPQNGACEIGDRCSTFDGCEVCNAGTCEAVNTGGACTNPEGDFNPCTVDDKCTILAIPDSLPEFAESARLPVGLAATVYDAQQAGQTRSFCMGAPGVGPTATPTPVPTVGPTACIGDCNDDRSVTVDELLTLVNIALGNTLESACDRGDINHDGDIAINEILAAVNAALNGCAG